VGGAVEDSCAPGAPAADDATCDGIDDDCDGLADEGYLPVATSCGIGACESAGTTSCVGGVVEDSCAPGTPDLDDAVCDGIDNDCDGAVDEEYLSLPTACGVGACAAVGATSCAGGAVLDSCVPGLPGTEYCDGIDNDCDGQKDEDDAVDALFWYRDADGDTHGDPATSMTSCAQPDGFVASTTDCDDTNANTYPGAIEFNDGDDNQCEGEPGYGLVDEITGVAGFHDPIDITLYSWPPQPGATLYEVSRSSGPEFSSDCTTFDSFDPFVHDSDTPAAGGTYFYLVRSSAPYAGSWGRNSAPIERRGVCPSDPNLLDDGGMEHWESSTDLTAWIETTIGGTVTEEENPEQIYAGFRAARLTRTATGPLNIVNVGAPFEPGQAYKLSFMAKSSPALPVAVQVRIRNMTRGEELQPSGTWSSSISYIGFGLATDYQQREIQFVVDPDHAVGDEFRLIIRHRSDTPIGTVLCVDDVAVRAQ
jgi:hypothetical protein